MSILKKTLITLSLTIVMIVGGIADYYLYKHFFGTDSIGPTIKQVYLDFEFDLYRTSNGVLLVSDHTVKKNVIANDRVRYELLIDYKTNPLIFSEQKNQTKKMRSKLDRHIIYYKMINDEWVKSNI